MVYQFSFYTFCIEGNQEISKQRAKYLSILDYIYFTEIFFLIFKRFRIRSIRIRRRLHWKDIRIPDRLHTTKVGNILDEISLKLTSCCFLDEMQNVAKKTMLRHLLLVLT